MTKYVEKTNIQSERIIVRTIKTRAGQLKIIQVYAPRTIHDDEDVEIFYKELGKALDENKSRDSHVQQEAPGRHPASARKSNTDQISKIAT
ncbi:hypothetical protein PoB_004841400 [Plakobranchus ocellatus]|uniref:Uncharacterized protein n=1 Tax=Plakobranchus ocellatus TaxID=259542 RepID=A0AAV4BSX3_9GAST|nr:hypothetical protein PoB_004841400 [Plakobranchus ocellatus]